LALHVSIFLKFMCIKQYSGEIQVPADESSNYRHPTLVEKDPPVPMSRIVAFFMKLFDLE